MKVNGMTDSINSSTPMGGIDSSCKIEQKNEHTSSGISNTKMNFFEKFMTRIRPSKRHAKHENTNQVKRYVQQFFQEGYAKVFENMNPHAKRVFAEAISKMPKEEKEMQLHAINKRIEEDPGDSLELKALRSAITENTDDVTNLLAEGNSIKKEWEAMNEEEKRSVFTKPENSNFAKKLNAYLKKIHRFTDSYDVCFTSTTPLGSNIAQVLIGIVNLKKGLEKNLGTISKLIQDNNGKIDEKIEKKIKDCCNKTDELFVTVQDRKMDLELQSKMSNEKNLEILRNDENSKKIKDLIGRDLESILVQKNLTNLRILSYLLDKQGHEIDNVDLFKSITGLNCSEAFIKTFIETFTGRSGNAQVRYSVGAAICAVNALQKNKTVSNDNMIRCMEKFCEDESCIALSKAFNAVNIEDNTGIKLTTKQLDVLVDRFGPLENIVKQINDFKGTGANDEMIKASIGILENFSESSSIVSLKDAYNIAKNKEAYSQRAKELMKKLDALGPKKGEPLVRPTKPRRTRW